MGLRKGISCPGTHQIGQFFFHEKTINCNIYLDMLENFAYPQLEDLQPDVILQQNGAYL